MAIEAIKEISTSQELASKYSNSSDANSCLETGVLGECGVGIQQGSSDNKRSGKSPEERAVNQDWGASGAAGFLKKSLGEMTAMEKRELISPEYSDLSVSAQCKLVGLQRSSYYRAAGRFKPKGEPILNQKIMKAIDRKFMDCPFYGVERVADHLCSLGYHVGLKRVRRLSKIINLRTIYRHGPPRKAQPK